MLAEREYELTYTEEGTHLTFATPHVCPKCRLERTRWLQIWGEHDPLCIDCAREGKWL